MVTIRGSNFIGNSASNGAIISIVYNETNESYYGPSFTIDDSVFQSNIATDSGGAIYISISDTDYIKTLNISNTQMNNNTAVNHGGAIYAKDFSINIASMTFEHNTANISGGAMTVMSDICDKQSVSLNIQKSTIKGSKSHIGGGIIIGCSEMYIDYRNQADETVFIDNTAEYSGGAIHSHHSCVSSNTNANVSFESNKADYGGDIAFTAGVSDGDACYSEFNSQSKFKNSLARVRGGSIHISYAANYDQTSNNIIFNVLPYFVWREQYWQNITTYMVIDKARFINTKGDEYGSAITIEYAIDNQQYIDENSTGLPISMTVSKSVFNTNKLSTTSYGGNAITFLAHHKDTFQELIVSSSTFTNNDFDTSYGGHMWIDLNICTKDLSNYVADNCSCINQYSNSNTRFSIYDSTFTKSKALYGGAVYSKLPINIDSEFTNTQAIEGGGAIYIGCAREARLTNCNIKNTMATKHGGGVLLNQLQNVFIESTSFDSCKSEYAGGAVAYFMGPKYDSNITISNSCQFTNNEAAIGGAVFSSQHRPNIIAKTKQSVTIIKNISLTANVELKITTNNTFDTQYVFALLQPVDENGDTVILEWKQDYQWNDTVIDLKNTESEIQSIFSTIDDSRFISPLFIPFTTEENDEGEQKSWTVKKDIDWKLEINFAPFWDTLAGNVAELTFNMLLLSYPFKSGSTEQNIEGKSLSIILNDNVEFSDNFASALGAAIYLDDDLYSSVSVQMNHVEFISNIASGLTAFAINSYIPKSNINVTVNKQISASDVEFTDNIAHTSSACLALIATNIICDRCTFSNNEVSTFGAALYIKNGKAEIKDTIIENNDSPLGGNILAFKSALQIQKTQFIDNTALFGNGAGISVYNLHELIMETYLQYPNLTAENSSFPDLISIIDCSFVRQISSEDGAAVYMHLDNNIDYDFNSEEDETDNRRRTISFNKGIHRRLLQYNQTDNNTNNTNHTIPIFTTTKYHTTKIYTTNMPTTDPTAFPTMYPTENPSNPPSNYPTTKTPSISPTEIPTQSPTLEPTIYPTKIPTTDPTGFPTTNPSLFPTINPTQSPTLEPTIYPTKIPTTDPTGFPTTNPSLFPTINPTQSPTLE
eukprot:376637_1